MKILGLDPGSTSGWCLYDDDERRVVASGQFAEHNVPLDVLCMGATLAVIERPKGYGPTRPQLVDCGYVAGRIVERASRHIDTHEMTRHEVKRALTEATSRTVVVTKDASAWAALKLLHGGDACAKKGGALHGVKSHERAALAVAVAWSLKSSVVPA